jgi:hypothetical protein
MNIIVYIDEYESGRNAGVLGQEVYREDEENGTKDRKMTHKKPIIVI